jgi:threonine/homoserine/homoserine lactone efflux protein
MLIFFIKGLIIGFSVAAPVGAIGLLCIRRSLTQGPLLGFVSGLGAATADTLYGLVAGCGFTFLSHALIENRLLLQFAGGIFLCWLGVKSLRSSPSPLSRPSSAKGEDVLKAYLSTFFLTVANPATILSFIGVFAGLGLAERQGNLLLTSCLVLGIFLGSTLWWFVLCYGVGLLRERFTLHSLRWVNYISGFVIISFGLFALYKLV